MALLSLLFGSPSQTKIERSIFGKTSALILDATLKESFSITGEATDFPVEDGADLSDHYVIKPDKLSIEGTITETPFSIGGQITGAIASVGASLGEGLGNSRAGALGKTLGGLGGAVGGGLVGKSLLGLVGLGDRSLSDIVDEFKAIRDSAEPVTIQTGLTKYEDYLMLSCQISRDQTTGRSIRVAMEFKELITVTSETTLLAIPKIKGGLPGKKLGRKNKGGLDASKVPGSSLLNSAIFGGK